MSQIPLAGPAKPISVQPQGVPQSGFRGFRVETSQAAMRSVGMAPQIDVQSAVRADLSVGSIGQALSNVGEKMNNLAIQQMELKNVEKISGSEIVLAEQGSKLALEIANEEDETKWGSLFQTRAAEVRKALLDDQKLSPRAKAAIEEKVARWTASRSGEISISSFQRTRQKATENFQVLRAKALDVNDWEGADRPIVDAVNSGLLSKGAGDMALLENQKARKEWHKKEAGNYLKQGLATGDDSFIAMATENLRMGGADENDIKTFEATSAREMKTAKTRLNNEREAEVIGDLLLRKARGTKDGSPPILKSEVDQLIKDGIIDKRTGAYFTDVTTEMAGVPDDIINPLLDEASLYDPDDDENFSKQKELMKKASNMSLSPAQTQQFMNVFSTAREQNLDANRKFETAALVGARKVLDEAVSRIGAERVWTPHLAGALTDVEKLQKFGIAKPVAEKIRALMGKDKNKKDVDSSVINEDGKNVTVSKNYAEAFRLFKSSATTRPDQASSGLDEWQYELFRKAADSDADGTIIDRDTKLNNILNTPVMRDQLDRWFQGEVKKSGRYPTDMELKQRLGQMLSGAHQAQAASRFTSPVMKTVESPNTMIDDGPPAPAPTALIDLPPSPTGFGVTTKTRDELSASSVGSRQVSLDFNDAENTAAKGIEIVIPDDATDEERAAAEDYVNETQRFFAKHGVDVPVRGVKTRSENGRGTVGRFHTEPFFVGDKESVAAMKKDPEGYAKVLAETLGRIGGITFIAPHKTNDPGATRGSLNERDFAREYILPKLKELAP
jgi:hypothetical protein